MADGGGGEGGGGNGDVKKRHGTINAANLLRPSRPAIANSTCAKHLRSVVRAPRQLNRARHQARELLPQ